MSVTFFFVFSLPLPPWMAYNIPDIANESLKHMASLKEQIIWTLEMLDSEAEQLHYEKNVPHVDITSELLCQWFDDLFHGEAPILELIKSPV